jgi:predicted dienelactone hydrolase
MVYISIQFSLPELFLNASTNTLAELNTPLTNQDPENKSIKQNKSIQQNTHNVRPRINRPRQNHPHQCPHPIISLSPIDISSHGRIVNLHLKVTAPVIGHSLPIILLSHGHGLSNNLSSLHGYGPLANLWATHGFVVIQPTHLSSKTLSLDPKSPRRIRGRRCFGVACGGYETHY